MAPPLCVLKLAVPRGMLDGYYDDLVGFLIESVIDKVRIFAGDELPHAFDVLRPAYVRKYDEVLHGIERSARTRSAAAGLCVTM